MPEEDDRRRLWEAQPAAERSARADGIDLDFLAQRFKVSGGNIRNICVDGGVPRGRRRPRPSRWPTSIRATEREYRKLGRLTVEAEFGEYLDLVATG